MANPLRRIYQKLESISCLCAEGPEFMGKLQIADAIQKEALSALAICKSVLQPVVQADVCMFSKEKYYDIPCMNHNCKFYNTSMSQNCGGENNGESAVVACKGYRPTHRLP